MYRPLSATRTQSCEIRPCLRILSASNSATRSAPVLAWRDGGSLCVCRAGRCTHRPLRIFIGNRCVGVGLPDDPSRTCAAALAKLSLRASDRRHRPWRSVPPAPRFLCLRRLPFFLQQKKGRKERRQNQGFGILYAAGVSSTSVSSYLADRDVQNLHLAFV